MAKAGMRGDIEAMKIVIGRFHPAKAVSMAVMAAVLAGSTGTAFAQDTLAEMRIRKMEAEIKALQRKVFPGGDDRFFQPEISANGEVAGTSAAQPATSAVTDILTRMDALEAQIARLTGQIEQNSNRIAQLEKQAGIASPGDAPAAAVAAGAAVATTATGAATPTPAPTPTPSPAPTPAPQSNLDAMTGGASAAKPAPAPAAAPAPALSDRAKAVSAIVKPQTDEPADDEYSYGFRLWDAKFYPEAQQQLKIFLEKYPNHWRASWGRNLLGRAYLDDGNAYEAAKWFLQNYKADKNGGRAPDSLLYLAVAMKERNDKSRACIALSEFSETYAAEAAGRLQGLYDATRKELACGG